MLIITYLVCGMFVSCLLYKMNKTRNRHIFLLEQYNKAKEDEWTYGNSYV